jgi:tripartite-type tricarboxylate transporter receptor subunit TctC
VLADLNESEAWRRELNRYFWHANFLTGAALRAFLDNEAAAYRVRLTELGLNK